MTSYRVEALEMKIALLRKAKDLLKADNPYYGVCVCVSLAAEELSTTVYYSRRVQLDQAELRLSCYICNALGRHAYLNGWVAEATGKPKLHREKASLAQWREYCTMMYNTRAAWIDWMIAQYQDQLDEIQEQEAA